MRDGFSRGGIAGILAPDLIAGLEDRAQHDAQAVLRSRRQHDLVGIAAQPARRQQMIGDRGAKLAAAARVAILQMLGAEGAHAPADKRPEALQGPLIDMGAAERQGALLRRFDDDLRLLRASLTRAGMRAATKVPEPTVATAKPSAISRS